MGRAKHAVNSMLLSSSKTRNTLTKIFETYRTGLMLEFGNTLKPLQIVENKNEIIITCGNLDHAIVFDKRLFNKKWAERA